MAIITHCESTLRYGSLSLVSQLPPASSHSGFKCPKPTENKFTSDFTKVSANSQHLHCPWPTPKRERAKNMINFVFRFFFVFKLKVSCVAPTRCCFCAIYLKVRDIVLSVSRKRGLEDLLLIIFRMLTYT